jgi:predicted nucleotidyltransferase
VWVQAAESAQLGGEDRNICRQPFSFHWHKSHRTTPNLASQTLACDKDGHKEAVAELEAEIHAQIVKLVKQAKLDGKKTNYMLGRMLYKMLMRPATSMVEVRHASIDAIQHATARYRLLSNATP